MRFSEFNISEDILKGIEEMGFEEASPIQKESIPPLLEGHDLTGQAQTGTGKTAAFGIPILEMVTSKKEIQGLVLCPTRELSVQVADELNKIGKYKNIKVLPIYGGASFDRQVKSLNKGVQVVVGTPGRVMDHMRRSTIKFDKLKILVLDEADEMLDMGFRDDMKYILDRANKNKQTCFFSATMNKGVDSFSKDYQKDPVKIKIEHKELTVENIDQFYIELNESMKTETTTRLIDIYDPKLTIIFCNTKRKVDKLVSQLLSRGYVADGLHGDLRQNQRDKVMDNFRNSVIDILVATDVAARGIDIGQVDMVINYDLPQDEEYYVHRIGRTARAGRSGQAFSLVTGKDIGKLKTIIQYTNADIKYLEIPTLDDLNARKVEQLQEYIRIELEKDQDLGKYRKIVDNLMIEDYTPTEICEVLIKLALEKESLEGHERLKNVDYGQSQNKTNLKNKKAKRKIREPEIFINKGKRDDLTPGEIIGLIVENTNLAQNKIGDINIKNNFTFVEIPEDYIEVVVEALNGKKLRGKEIQVEKAGK